MRSPYGVARRAGTGPRRTPGESHRVDEPGHKRNPAGTEPALKRGTGGIRSGHEIRGAPGIS
ncbi:hypothetical protein ACFXPA_36430 [Amycolatopsis sp. NPDC059090]|uniref:hypothetical protein n=1 Tax=unclassified Amycolatopsis TaxID=2618356 RepID=UPI00366B1E5C